MGIWRCHNWYLLLSMLAPSTLANEYLAQSAQYAAKEQSTEFTNVSGLFQPEQAPNDTTDQADEIWQGVSSSFEFSFDDLGEGTFLDRLSGNIGYHHPLLRTEDANTSDAATQGRTNHNSTGTLSLKYSIVSSWFVSATFYYYFDKAQQQPWNPDFTYVFGYSDWRPYTLSLVYSNYGGNRFSPTGEEKYTEFDQGTWALGWKFPITAPVIDWLRFNDKGAIGCQVDYNYTKEYFDLASISYKNNHQTLSLGCKYTLVGNWYVNGTAFYYFDRSQQQPWNPDFTYGFGYFDWRPGTITLQYNNYSGNRWKSSTRGADTGRFKDGSITLAYSFSF
ncbi:hypothetical protein HGP28_03885 [Vibrio sp. SM6]|uniref:Porin n=1 Tax=Vibrio agarilyticus TaxID=2726741 RepID=A0A7X8TP15_9VIBR|nr:hypothetical protein [Vibrio agarilyticus]NLS12032.1 hypothetical protein [Vibrio agarilyticus]